MCLRKCLSTCNGVICIAVRLEVKLPGNVTEKALGLDQGRPSIMLLLIGWCPVCSRMINNSLKSNFTQINFFIHNLAQIKFSGHQEGALLSFIPKTYR